MPFFPFPPSQPRPPPTPITMLPQHSQTPPNNSLIRTASFKPYTIPTPTSASPSTITSTLAPISSTLMAESTEEQLEPLFDYHRVQPFDVVCLDDDCSDSSLTFSPKQRKLSYTAVEKVDKNEKFIEVVDCEDKEDDDWLPPPLKVSADTLKLGEDSTKGVEVYPEGTHLMIPWFERPIVDDVRAHPNLVESSSGSHDLQMVSCEDHTAGE